MLQVTWPAAQCLRHTQIFWPHYQMCTLCTVTAPGTSDCSAAEWARQINMSHVVTLSHSDTPIANTPVYTHSVQPFRLLYALFPAFSTTNKPNADFGLFRLLCYLFHQNLIHYLIMVLPVKNGNIAFCSTCTQASGTYILYILASCIPYLLFPIGQACFVHLSVLCLLLTNHHKKKFGGKKLEKAKNEPTCTIDGLPNIPGLTSVSQCFRLTCLEQQTVRANFCFREVEMCALAVLLLSHSVSPTQP